MVTENTNSNLENKISFLKRIDGLERYVLALTVFCYVVGFAITNLYLGSLGVNNFDILRIRYILTGLLFVFFWGIILLPLYGLIHVLHNSKNISTGRILSTVFIYTLNRYTVIFFVVLAVGTFALKRSNPLTGLTNSTISYNWSGWLTIEVPALLSQSLRWLLIIIGFLVLILVFITVLVLLINPNDKDGRRPTRKGAIRDLWTTYQTEGSLTKFIKELPLIFAIILGTQLITSLITFISSNIEAGTAATAPGGLLKFLTIAFLLYLFAGVFILVVFFLHSSSPNDDTSPTKDDPLNSYYGWVFLFAIGVLTIVPIYALSIYPEIPQQIGGGEPVEVFIHASDELTLPLPEPAIRSYILDRTSEAVILLLVDEQQQNYMIVEVPESEIRSIIYKQPTLTLLGLPSATETPFPPTLTPAAAIPLVPTQ